MDLIKELELTDNQKTTDKLFCLAGRLPPDLLGQINPVIMTVVRALVRSGVGN